MKVIGAGFSRTGTYSLKQALEALGFDPCYHGEVIFQRPDHVAIWNKALDQTPNWAELFSDYQAGLDSPICFYWREILATFPEAKVILTVRDADAWYESFQSTLYHGMLHPDQAPQEIRGALAMAKALVLDHFFNGRFSDRDYAINVYNQHIESVKSYFQSDDSNLLVFNLEDGWSPLCQFLNREVPNEPFPRSNSRSEFSQLFT